MGAPLGEDLLFCLFSLLFGGLASVFTECLRTLFTAFGLIPRETSERKLSVRVALGYFVYDVLLYPSLAALYLIFLFFTHEGVFRVYSLLLCVLGFFLFTPVARWLTRPLGYLLSRAWKLIGAPVRLFCGFLRRLPRKKRKRLDENGKMM